MRKTIFFCALALFAVIAVAVGPRRTLSTASRENKMSVKIDSVKFRDDVTRVYCRVIGTPHTSQCIDSAKLHIGASTTLEATDIDPIYFTRAFQWEDEPDMPLEIDFPAVAPAPDKKTELRLDLLTPRGTYSDRTSRAI